MILTQDTFELPIPNLEMKQKEAERASPGDENNIQLAWLRWLAKKYANDLGSKLLLQIKKPVLDNFSFLRQSPKQNDDEFRIS